MNVYLVFFWITVFSVIQAQEAPDNMMVLGGSITTKQSRSLSGDKLNHGDNSTPESISVPMTEGDNVLLNQSGNFRVMSARSNESQPKSFSAIIVAVSLGSVLLAVLSLIGIWYYLRRRRRKFPNAHLDSRYAFAHDTSLSPTPSRSWLLRQFREHPTAELTSVDTSMDASWPDGINFYHTPRPPRKAYVKKPRTGAASSVSNGTETSLSSMRFAQKTERQMEIEERIEELKGKLALLQRTVRAPRGRPDSRTLVNMTHNMRIGKWRKQIEKLQDLMTSDWALGRTDVVPRGLHYHSSTVT